MQTFENLNADLASQPVTGYLPDGRYINIPLVSHVVDNLYVGGYDYRADFGDFFSHVFSLYKWESYEPQTGPDTVHRVWSMYDSPRGVDVQDLDENPTTIEAVADEVVAALEAGGNVLVHCQAGINRSNLTAAIVLMRWKGLTAAESIDMLRTKRSPLALANRTFENYLRALDA
jgi:protein-tyrosine phosphatase